MSFSTAIEQYQDFSDRGTDLMTAGKAGDALDLLSSDAMMAFSERGSAAAERWISNLNAKIGMDESQAVAGASYRATWISAGSPC